jgi:DNA mismatch endonuclease (patch repair protein)
MERVLREKLQDGQFQGGTAGNSRRMKAIRDRRNKSTEMRFRAMLVRAPIRGWQLRPSGLPGKPDFLFPEHRLVVFLDGCYWHGCPRCGHIPGVNRPYWSAKIERNRARDKRNTRLLKEAGYAILRLWEHELREEQARCLSRLRALLERQGTSATEGDTTRRVRTSGRR